MTGCANTACTAHARSSIWSRYAIRVRRNASADGGTTYHQLNATVHLPSGRGGVCGYWIVFPEPFRVHVAGGDALGDQEFPYGGGAFFREPLIVVLRSRIVGKTVNLQPQVWVSQNDTSHFGQSQLGSGTKRGFIEVE